MSEWEQVTVDKMLAAGEAHARKVLLEEREERLTAFYHLVLPDGGDNIIIPCLWRDESAKEMIVETVKEIARRVGAVGVMFVGESWMVRVEGETIPSTMDPPSQQPGRVEVVTIIARTREGTGQRLLQMVRDTPGGPLSRCPI